MKLGLWEMNKLKQIRCVFTRHKVTGSQDIVDYTECGRKLIHRTVRCNKCGLIIKMEEYRTTFWDSKTDRYESEPL